MKSRCLFLLFALVATPLTIATERGSRLEVTATYHPAEGEVIDEAHPLFVILFDGPPGHPTSHMTAVEMLSRNGGKATFEKVAEEVHVVTLYDPSGNFTGLSGMIPGMVIGAYVEEGATEPTPVRADTRTRIEIEFDSTTRLPGDVCTVVPATVQKADKGILEIRTYTARPGMREQFIEFFENRTLDGQRDAGLRVIGQFRHLQNEDTFVWIRAYESQAERVKELRDYYLGPAWLAVQKEAETLIADTHVMLVAPTSLSDIR